MIVFDGSILKKKGKASAEVEVFKFLAIRQDSKRQDWLHREHQLQKDAFKTPRRNLTYPY
jgi:hypothetical protein